MSYKKLEIWQLADELVVLIHEMTLTKLPKFEMFEEGAQIRKSIKNVKATIVEGYGRKRYKAEFIKGSCLFSWFKMMKRLITWKTFITQSHYRMKNVLIKFIISWKHLGRKLIYSSEVWIIQPGRNQQQLTSN